MGTPNAAQVATIKSIVSTVVSGLQQDTSEFIAPKLLPPVKVSLSRASIFQRAANQGFRNPAYRGNTGMGGGFETLPPRAVTTIDYDTMGRRYRVGIHEDEVRSLEARGMSAELDSEIERLNTQLLSDLEHDCAQLFMTHTNWLATEALSGADQWTNDGSRPFKQLDARIRALRAVGCPRPNTLVMSDGTASALRSHGGILSFLGKDKDAQFITNEALAAIFKSMLKLDLYIGDGVTGTDDAASGDLTGAHIWPDGTVWVGYLNSKEAFEVRQGIRVSSTAAIRLVEQEVTDVAYYDEDELTYYYGIKTNQAQRRLLQNSGTTLTTVI